jgi:hypothetical protein
LCTTFPQVGSRREPGLGFWTTRTVLSLGLLPLLCYPLLGLLFLIGLSHQGAREVKVGDGAHVVSGDRAVESAALTVLETAP